MSTNMNKTAIALLGLFAMGAAGFAHADREAPAPRGGQPSDNPIHRQQMSDEDMKASQSGKDTQAIRMGFGRLDSDGDGVLSYGEAAKQAKLRAEFENYDRNNDKNLSMSEFSDFAEKHSDSLLNEEADMPGQRPEGSKR